MIRYIRIGNQISLDPERPACAFAFFDTVEDHFVVVAGEQVWESVADFEGAARLDHALTAKGRARLLGLIPEDQP